MRFNLLRFTNSVILIAITMLTLTGVYGLFWALNGWVFDIHRAAGWFLIAAIPWKSAISLRSLRRGLGPGFDRGLMIFVSLFLAALALLVIGLGLLWTWRLGPGEYWLRQTAVSWHWMLGLGLLLPLGVHVWRRWPRPKKVDFASRRAALKMLALGVAGLSGWWLAERLAQNRIIPDAPRRVTGSRLDGFFSANRYPVTHNVAALDSQVDSAQWRLSVEGAVQIPRMYTYEELLALVAREQIATIDCTLGWYSTQNWRGIPLQALLEQAGPLPGLAVIKLQSVTGYSELLPSGEARQVLLATHVGGEPLEHQHGFPLRAVVPTRRGWFWVKWLASIEVVSL